MDPGKLVFLIPKTKILFEFCCIKISELLKMIFVGSASGEIIGYKYQTMGKSSNPLPTVINFYPKILLCPHPNQKSGFVVDMEIVEYKWDEQYGTSQRMIISLHQDNCLRIWSVQDGRCMAVSLINLFNEKLTKLYVAEHPRYVYCIGKKESIYLVDSLTMKLVKILKTTCERIQLVSVSPLSVELMDNRGDIYVWKNLSKADYKSISKLTKVRLKESSITSENLNLATYSIAIPPGSSVISFHKAGNLSLIIFKNHYCLVEQVEATYNSWEASFQNLDSEIVFSVILENTSVLLVTKKLSLYLLKFLNLKESAKQFESSYKAEELGSLMQNLGERIEFSSNNLIMFSSFEKLLFITENKTMSIKCWNLNNIQEKLSASTQIPGVIKEAWPYSGKVNLEIDIQLNRNRFKHNETILEKNEIIVSNCLHFVNELCTPYYIVGTNKGYIYMIPLFSFPKLKTIIIPRIEGHKGFPVNCLFLMKGKLVSSSVDGTLAIIDISAKKINEFVNKNITSDNSLSFKIVKYPELYVHDQVEPSGISQIMEIKSMINDDNAYEESSEKQYDVNVYGSGSSIASDSLAVIGGSGVLLIISIDSYLISHTFRGLDAQIVGIYIQELQEMLIVVSKSMTAFFFHLSSSVLERKVSPDYSYTLFNLDEKLIPFIGKNKTEIKYSDLIKSNLSPAQQLIKGSNVTLDFCSYMESYQMDFRHIYSKKAQIYNILMKKMKNIHLSNIEEEKATYLKLYNSSCYFTSNLFAKFEKRFDDGFLGLRINIGEEDPEVINNARQKNTVFKGKMDCTKKFWAISLQIEDIIENLKSLHFVRKATTLVDYFDKAKTTSDSSTSSNSVIFSSNILESHKWPLPLLSMVYPFDQNTSLDNEFETEFGICQPILETWIGCLGVEETFSFVIPETEEEIKEERLSNYNGNLKISQYLNSQIILSLLTPLVQIVDQNEEIIGPFIKKLILILINLFKGSKIIPGISLSHIAKICIHNSIIISATARDLILIPFIKESRPENLIKTFDQNSFIMKKVVLKIEKEGNLGKWISLFYEIPMKRFDEIKMINNYVGSVELRALTVLFYSLNLNSKLVFNKEAAQNSFFLIQLLLGELHTKCLDTNYYPLLVHILFMISFNVNIFSELCKGNAQQILFIIYSIHSSISDNISKGNLLRLDSDNFVLFKAQSTDGFLLYVAEQTLLALGDHFPLPYAEMLVLVISQADIDVNFPYNGIELLRQFIKQSGNKLEKMLVQFAEIVINCTKFHESSSKKKDKIRHSISQFVHTLKNKYPMVSFHEESNRLTVGIQDGSIIIYDIRLHIAYKRLNGHTHPVSALAMSKDGSKVASYSLEEKQIRIWDILKKGLFATMKNVQTKSKIIEVDNYAKREQVPFQGSSDQHKTSIKFIGEKNQQISLDTEKNETFIFSF